MALEAELARRQDARAMEARRVRAQGIRPQPGPQTTFFETKADIAIYGGAAGGGKSWGILAQAMRHIDVPGFGGVIFRRTSPQITNEGGLWDESMKIYPEFGGDPKQGGTWWQFPAGPSIAFSHLQHEKTKLDWQGSQIPFLGFDELTHFTETQFWYMLSRNRSTCGVKPYVRATTNPDADSWVAEFIAWWINPDTGYAIPERSGRIRWFVRDGDDLVWADTPEELAKTYPDIPPKSLTFISSTLEDNKILMSADPSYKANLLAMSSVERERLLRGNWKIRREGGMFKREWFEIVDAIPVQGADARAYDLAATEVTADSPDPDWTVGLKGRKVGAYFYIMDMDRYRLSPGKRDARIKALASHDGRSCTVRIPQDPAQAGKSQATYFISLLAGWPVQAMPVSGDKALRAAPAASQAEFGFIKLARGEWNAAFLAEVCAFSGLPGATGHDDIVDALSDLIDVLSTLSTYSLDNVS